MAKKKVLEKKVSLSILEWCNQQVDEGKELKLCWDGGGDSGWCYFELDGDTVENEYTSRLVDMMYDELDYGSWAGEFSANGEAIYNKEEQAFIGIDNYGEDITIPFDVNILVKVPKHIHFDNLELNIEDEGIVSVSLSIKNGFLHAETQTARKEIENSLKESVNEAINEFSESHEFKSLWYNEIFSKENFTKDTDGNLTMVIRTIDIGSFDNEEKDIYLDISNLTQPIKLNED